MGASRWNSSPYFCFEWTYLDTEDDAIEREKERNEISVARRICFGQKKVVNASLAVECVRNWICDSGAKKLLDFYVIDLPYKPGFPVIRMRDSLVHDLLLPYILSPTKLICDKFLQMRLAEDIETVWVLVPV